jgi:tRNA nucleotidyltransferase (CCA-adding enzyme)
MTIPERFKKVARVTIQHHLRCHRLSEAKASSVARLLRDLGAYRDPGIVTLFAQACEADARGRQGFENRDYPQADILKKAFDASSNVNGAMFIAQGQAPGPAIGQKVIAEQVRRIRHELGGSSPD